MLTRRQLLRRGGAAGAGLVLARVPIAVSGGGARLAKFVDPLPVPGAGWAVRDLRAAAGTTIRAREFATPLHSGLPLTRVWGYGSPKAVTHLGPTLVVRRGSPVEVTVRNRLPATALIPQDPAVVPNVARRSASRINTHLHGGHIEDASDGNPYHVFAAPAGRNTFEPVPGEQQTLTYANDQATALLFYHDHAIGVTRTNVYAGMAGGYVITDDEDPGPLTPEGSAEWSAGLRLPGAGYDIPLILQDREVNHRTGGLIYPATWAPEFFGDTVLVNGRAWPYLAVQRRKYRLRILNGSNSRFYNLDFGTGVRVWAIGGDLGRLRGAPVELTSPGTVLLAPGERADVVVDFSTAAPNKRQTTVTDVALPAGTVSPTRPIGGVLQFRFPPAGPEPVADPSVLPAELGGPAPPAGEDARRTITLDEVMGRGGKPVAALLNNTHFMHMASGELVPVTETPGLGSTEVWELVNLTADTHPIHLHLVHFEVVERQPLDLARYLADLEAERAGDPGAVLGAGPYAAGPPQPPAPQERCPKDTVRANPGEITRIRATFDRAGRYVYHCHILEHEENEMMRPFEVS